MRSGNGDDLESIRKYYDYNTPRFLSYGEQRRTRTIHRPVWGDGVQDEEQALHYVHKLILAEGNKLRSSTSGELHALDLGCGVGASLFYLAHHLGKSFSGVGLTISPVQAKIALQESRKQNLTDKCRFLVGNFLAPPLRWQFDLIFSIEAFAHSSDPEGYFQAAARLLKPGGKLVLCDDFLSVDNQGAALNAQHQRWLNYFRQGWGVNGMKSAEYVQNLAAEVDFKRIKNLDLTPNLKLNPLPESVFALFTKVLRDLAKNNPYWRSVVGGQALRLCLSHRVVEYRYMVFELASVTDE